MLAPSEKSPERARAAAQIKQWTRSRFGLASDAVISVSQIDCAVPGCPPVETVVMFWTGTKHYHFKVFKPLADVLPQDLPPSWFMPALAVPEGAECGCC
jgi:coenzyme F420-reducing hydrogenase gamma subunit